MPAGPGIASGPADLFEGVQGFAEGLFALCHGFGAGRTRWVLLPLPDWPDSDDDHGRVSISHQFAPIYQWGE